MRTIAHRTLSLSRTSLEWIVMILLLVCPSQIQAKNSSGSIVLREDFAQSHRERLTETLQAITGWTELKFDHSGALGWKEENTSGGSQSARELLARAVSGASAIVLEDASKRSDVIFCRVVPGRWIGGITRQTPAYVVLIDFDDFQHVMGDQLARNSFNVGWGVLHEIDHIVNDSADADVLGHTGECEEHINAMRRELNLPERAEYFCTLIPFKTDGNFSTKFVRLAFDQPNQSGSKKRRYWLTWDASVVGALDQKGQIALVR